MNWGTDDIIPKVARDYVSVEWNGFLEPLYSESYTFYAEANDGIRVHVNDKLLIDYLVDSTSDTDIHLLTSTPITLTANEMVPIRVMYYDTTGVAMISLLWESTSQPKEIVPSTAFYYKQSEVPITGNTFMIEA